MDMLSLGDILQAKVDKLLGDIEGIKKYTNNISLKQGEII